MQQTVYNRRPHQKSRYGCRQCKQRKVKCDELKPSCSHCIRYAVECAYSAEPPRRKSTRESSAISASPASEQKPPRLFATDEALSPASSTSTGATPSSQNNMTSHPRPPQPLFSLLDMELLHYYTCYTSLTLSRKPERQKARQEVLPQLAFEHEFVMHGVLALAAMHLAHDNPSRRETLRLDATRRQDLGLKIFRQEMQRINKYNCDALFAFSSVLVMFTWASSSSPENFFFRSTDTDEDLYDCTALVRGVNDLLGATWQWVSKGPMATFLQFTTDGMTLPTLPRDVCDRFEKLTQIWTVEACRLDEAEIAGLQSAHEILKDSYIYLSVPDDEVCKVSTAYFWLTRIPMSYTTMLQQQKPEALVLLAHYCIVLDSISESWWMEDKGVQLLRVVHNILPVEWRPWIAWPMDLLGA